MNRFESSSHRNRTRPGKDLGTDRRTFLSIALAAPVFGQAARPPRRAARAGPPGRSGAVRTGTSRPRRRASRTPGRRAGRRSSGNGRSARATRRRPSRTACSTRCTASRAGGGARGERRDRRDAVGARHADDVPERRARDGQRPVRDAARRRRSAVHDRRRRPPAVPRQEDRQAAVDPAAVGRPSRLAR